MLKNTINKLKWNSKRSSNHTKESMKKENKPKRGKNEQKPK